MSRPAIFSTRPLFEPARQLLNQHFDVDYWTTPGTPPREQLLRRASDKDGLICLLTEKVDAELLSRAPNLRMVATVSVGFDHIDVAACTQHHVIVTHTPGVLDDTTADFAWTLLMAIARRVVEGQDWMRSGDWQGWDLDQLCGADVHGKTLGILGFGRIGREVAKRAQGFSMRILYNDAIRAPEEAERELHAEFAPRERVLAESDFVTLHVPLLPATRHFMSHSTLSQMKPAAYLINTSRGPVVDEAALVSALDAGKIAGAALDVFENEPRPHPGLLKRKNVLLTPHIASASVETRTKMAMMAAENTVAFFNGRRPPNALNPEVLEKRA